VKFLVERQTSVTQTGNFSWKSKTFAKIPPLVAAIISDQKDIVDFLILSIMSNSRYLDHLLSEKRSEEDAVQQTDVSELTGAAFILASSSKKKCVSQLKYWRAAMNLLKETSTGEDALLKRIPSRNQTELYPSATLKLPLASQLTDAIPIT
jgi:hypothetical protein